METKRIDVLNADVSRVALGTWALGGWLWGGTEKNVPQETIHKALDMGINFIDTAPVYGFGTSEELVGKAVKEHSKDREKIFIATKAGLDWKNEKPFRNSSIKRLQKEIDDSLRRLQTDYIDIYQIHWPDPKEPIERTAEFMNKLLEEGKIRSIGVSNYSPEQMDAFRRETPLHFCQPPYNLFERGIEEDVMPYCKENDIRILAYGSICRGLLSGKMTRDTEFKDDDIRSWDPKFQEPRYTQYLQAVEILDEYAAAKYDKRVIHLAVRWALDSGADFALWGARKPEQVEDTAGVPGWKIDETAMKEIYKILKDTLKDPVGPEFMGPPARD